MTSRWLLRIRRALALDPELFEEVEHDHSAGPQALAVVLAASLSGSIGSMAAARVLGWPVSPGLVMVAAVGFLVAWTFWSFVTMAVGTSFFGGRADMGEMQRTLGFAASPGLLMVVPGVGALVGVPWALLAMVIAVRQALDFVDTRRALLVVAISTLITGAVLLPTGCFLKSQGLGAVFSEQQGETVLAAPIAPCENDDPAGPPA
ncbi:MAG: YIP1 family protein [Acidobacteriota bacterium]